VKFNLEQERGLRVIVELERGATKGATVGKNLYWPGGSVVTEEELRAGMPPTPVTPGTTITSWSLILNIPQNVQALAGQSGAGLFVLDGAGNSFVRELTSIDGSVTITNPNGVVGDIDLSVAVSGGGILPMVTGEVYADQPRFVYNPDGTLIYARVE
jgi:hypothetical protein